MKSIALTWFTTMALFAVLAIVSPAQTITTLVKFDGDANPQGSWLGTNLTSLLQGRDGNLWGSTQAGGAYGTGCAYAPAGTVFKVTPGGTLTTVHVFQPPCSDGAYPQSGIILSTNGNFYGTTQQGGSTSTTAHNGTVFKITPAGALKILFRFPNDFDNPPTTDGSEPIATLVQGTDGNFYGTTTTGGQNSNGTIFKITAAGVLTPLFSFPKTISNPYGTLIQATDGNFYGTTRSGGTNSAGTVYRITPSGVFTTFYNFLGSCGASCSNGPWDGQWPNSGLVQGADGNFYGTTEYGGKDSGGAVFKITPGGQETVLHSFGGSYFPGSFLDAPLIQATDGNFYGTTVNGGDTSCFNGCGAIFSISPTGNLTLLYQFSSAAGNHPAGGLLQYTDGSFYGITGAGGNQHSGCNSGGCGTIFHLVVPGIGPFVKPVPTSGMVGTTVSILGNNLAGATSVKFNGVAAKFVASSTDIAATVPVGATTGTITVVTPSRTLSSNVKFQVIP